MEQVLALTQEEAQRRHPVQLEATVTYSDPGWGLLYVQDSTGGIAVEKLAAAVLLEQGDQIAIEGVTSPGPFWPVISAGSARVVKKGALPAAHWIRMFELNSGGVDAQWVEVSGVVQNVEEIGDRLRLELASGLNRCRVWVLKHQRYRNLKLTDSRIRVRGVAGAEFDGHHRLNGFQMYVASLRDVRIISTPPVGAFERPVTLGRDILLPMPMSNAEQRLHVRGVVTMQWPGRMVFIKDASGGVCLHTVSSPALRVGELVEAVGFRVVGSRTPQLESAVVRSVGMAEPAPPTTLPPSRELDDRLNYELLRLEARLVSVRSVAPDQICLSLSSGERSWTGYLQGTNLLAALPRLIPGSQLRLTGVGQFRDIARRRDRDLALWLRTPEDIQVLDVPLTDRQIALLWSAGTLGVVLVCAVPVACVRRKHRRHLQQTLAESKRHLDHHVEERKRIRQDLHDNILQSIYAVGLGLEDCRRLVQKSPEQAEQRIALATRVLNDVLKDVRQFIGGLQATTLSGSELKNALSSLAMITGENSSRFVIEADPTATHFLTPYQATQLLNVAKEAMSNSLRHAKANRTLVALGVDRDHVRLEIADDGIGFDPNALAKTGNGLRNLAARARDLGAHCEIISGSGKGTRVVVDLPPPDSL